MQPEDVTDEMLIAADLMRRAAFSPRSRASEERHRQDSLNAARIIYVKRVEAGAIQHDSMPQADREEIKAFLEAIAGAAAAEKMFEKFAQGMRGLPLTAEHARERLLLLAQKALLAAAAKVPFLQAIASEPHAGRRRQMRVKVATPPWVDFDEIAGLIRERNRMTRETGIPHHIDHIIPLAGKFVCGLHVHHNMRVITAAENVKKSAKFYETT